MKNKKRVIIIGGAGFLGSNLASRLVKDGGYEILVLDKKKNNNKNVKYFVGDYSDKEILNKIIKKGDIIFHFAGSSVPANAEKNITEEINNDIIKTINLLEICGKKKIKRIFFASSGGMVYGKYFRPISEKDITNPISFHGIIKLSIEKYVELFANRYGFEYVIMRISNLYGRYNSGDRLQGVLDVFLDRVLNNEKIEIWGDGSIVRDYIFIDDVVDFLEKILKCNICNEVFNVGNGKPYSLNDILKCIQKNTNKKIKPKYFLHRDFDLKYNVLNINKAKKYLKWKPRYDLNEGIKEIFKNIKNK